MYLKVCIHHEIQSKKVKEAHPGLQLVFDTVEAVDHNLLHLFLQNIARQLHLLHVLVFERMINPVIQKDDVLWEGCLNGY